MKGLESESSQLPIYRQERDEGVEKDECIKRDECMEAQINQLFIREPTERRNRN
jgi:hypothetical protein